MKRNKILALGLSAFLGVSSITVDVKAFENNILNETERSDVDENILTENNQISEQAEESVQGELQNEIDQNIEQQPEQDKNNENIDESLNNMIQTLPLLDENVEILNTSELANIAIENEKSQNQTAENMFEVVDGVITRFKNDFDTSNITEIVIPNEINGQVITRISENVFRNINLTPKIPTLRSITIKGNVDITSRVGMFSNYTNLESVNIPEITNIPNNTFSGCQSLETIQLPKVTEMATSVFLNCQNLRSVDAPELLYLNGNSTFDKCSALVDVNLPKLKEINGSVTFFGCTNLVELELPALEKLAGNHVFRDCASLETVNFPNLISIEDDKNLPQLSGGTFYNCTSLKNVKLPQLESITGNNIFYQCSKLNTINLPMLKNITGNSTFRSCQELTNINLPSLETINGNNIILNCNNVRTLELPNLILIGDNAFSSSSHLKTIYLNETIKIESGNKFSNQTTVYIPRFEDTENLDQHKNTWNAKDVKYYTISLTIKNDNLEQISKTNHFDEFELSEEHLRDYAENINSNIEGWQIEKDGIFEKIQFPYQVQESITIVPLISRDNNNNNNNNGGSIIISPDLETEEENLETDNTIIDNNNPTINGVTDSIIEENDIPLIDSVVDNNNSTVEENNTTITDSIIDSENLVVEEQLVERPELNRLRSVNSTSSERLADGINTVNLTSTSSINKISETEVKDIENAIEKVDNSLLNTDNSNESDKDLEVQKPEFGFGDNNTMGVTMSIFFLILILLLVATYIIKRQQQKALEELELNEE